jgi:hypothetical protein
VRPLKVMLTSSTILVFLLASASVAHAEVCGGSGWAATCDASNEGDHVDVGASASQPPADHSTGASGSGSNVGRPRPSATPTIPAPVCVTEFCRGNYDVWVIPEVTLADLASFHPITPSLGGEPDGVGVVGMPTNLIASSAGHTLRGRLFDYDVAVTFTPAGYRFDYGDGSSKTTTTGGSSWAQLGLAQFAPTATSHAYGHSGRYTVGVTALYSASVDFGGGVRRIVDGYVQVRSPGYAVRVVEVHTALVAHTCAETPTGPGC